MSTPPTATRTKRPSRPLLSFEVVRKEYVSRHLIRIVLTGPGIDEMRFGGFTDSYVKLVIPRPGVEYPTPFTMEATQAALPRDQWPAIRTYTIRRFDPVQRELWIDFVHHGDKGFAGPWAANAQPGDRLHLRGPGGAYSPDPHADWHLLAGDESALPAIATALEAMEPTARVTALIEVDSAEDEIPLPSPASPQIQWLHRAHGDLSFGQAVRNLEFPAGQVNAFIHGELGQIRDLKPYLLNERQIPADQLSISGYWRQGKDEDGFQAEKREEAVASANR